MNTENSINEMRCPKNALVIDCEWLRTKISLYFFIVDNHKEFLNENGERL